MYSVVNRQRYHLTRFSTDLAFSASMLMFVSTLIGLFYPGAEEMGEFIPIVEQSGLQGLFGDINVNNPGWVLWLAMNLNLVLYYVLAITAINVGLKLVPLREEEGLEIFVGSSPTSSQKYFIENILAGISTLLIISLPSLFILAGFSFYHNSQEFVARIALVFLFQLAMASINMLITASAAMRTFSRSSGKRWGYGYLIFCLLMELSIPALDEEKRETVKISMNYYLQPTSGLISGEFNYTGLGVLLLVGLVLAFLATKVLPSHDFTEDVGSKKTRRSLLPSLSAKNPVFQKFPLIVEQILQDRVFFMVWTMLIVSSFAYLIFTFQTQMSLEEFEQLLDGNNFGPLMGEYEIPATFLGFLAYELFVMHWLWFGVFPLIVAANIPTRDVTTSTQDSLYANDISPERVIHSRSIGLLVQYTIFHWTIAGTVFLVSWIFGADYIRSTLLVTFIAGWIFYIGFAILFITVAMLVKPSQGKKIAYWVFIIILSASFVTGSHLANVFNPLGYYEPVGIIVGSIKTSTAILSAVGFSLASIMFYLLVLKYRYSRHDWN